MSIRTLALSTALLLAAGLAAAQNPQYPWGQPGNSNATVQQNGQNVAYQRGMQDGMRDGQKDQQSGHSFRPTQTDKYKDTPGYTSLSGINHDQYVQLYRQSYMQGYQQGYNANAANNTNSTNRYCDQDGDDCAPQSPPVYGQGYPQQPNYPNGYPASNYPVYGQPGYGQGGQQIAFQRGAQQGQNDGLIAARQGKPGHGNDNYKNTPGYDASMGITFDQYRAAYRQGYKQAYDQAYRAGVTGAYPQQNYPVYGQPYPPHGYPQQSYPQQGYPVYGQPGYPVNGGYGGYGAQNAGYQRGYQDGINEGMRDRQSGHTYRPTKSDKYDDTPGYNSSYGDKNQWKQEYRQGFVNGYQQGYNGSPR